MPLYKIADFDPDYRSYFDEHDILGYDLYNRTEKVGSIDNILVDDEGRFRYFVINTGAWLVGKKVLLPIGRSRISYKDKRVYVDSISREQVERLPEYTSDTTVDYSHEEQVREVYRPSNAAMATAPVASTYDSSNYRYDYDPTLYSVNEQDHQNFKLYEERLIASKARQKTGEVAIGKRVETEQARVSVPVERERVVIQAVTSTDVNTPVAPGEAAFQEGEVARMEVYEETPDIRKEAFVREQVNVRKEVDQDVATANEQIRREHLDISTEGHPVVEKRPNPLPDDRI